MDIEKDTFEHPQPQKYEPDDPDGPPLPDWVRRYYGKTQRFALRLDTGVWPCSSLDAIRAVMINGKWSVWADLTLCSDGYVPVVQSGWFESSEWRQPASSIQQKASLPVDAVLADLAY